ncbi:hypothetical protein ACFWN2_21380 [Lentzea sp. NPDC058436]|uniref:hypothetical protein n=1 Tax=Lentzea sp. NPDC058436 TaxID=3346499 RepID=UPI00365DBE53
MLPLDKSIAGGSVRNPLFGVDQLGLSESSGDQAARDATGCASVGRPQLRGWFPAVHQLVVINRKDHDVPRSLPMEV